MVVIRFKVYFTLLLPATYFGSLYRNQLQVEVLFVLEGEITIDNIVVNCEISYYVSKIYKIL
jgi:hypothetical protein